MDSPLANSGLEVKAKLTNLGSAYVNAPKSSRQTSDGAAGYGQRGTWNH
ncbi:MAG: hypothetical protein WCK89_24895 [bacterium]